MKHSYTCNRDFDAKENVCPDCGSELQITDITEELDTDEIVSAMTLRKNISKNTYTFYFNLLE